jgi:nucleoside triphosphate pyrophosphatase
LGVPFEAVAPEVDELTVGEPEVAVVENARRKARAGMEMAGGESRLVLGVDTEVVLDGRLLGKAGNEGEARERLQALSGRAHEVLSGVVVLAPEGSTLDFGTAEVTNSRVGEGASPSVPGAGIGERSGLARSEVTFRDLPPKLLEAYLASGEWRDRAGAYAVQGLGSTLVGRVDGDLSNVIGLPVALLLELAPELLDAAGGSRC